MGGALRRIANSKQEQRLLPSNAPYILLLRDKMDSQGFWLIGAIAAMVEILPTVSLIRFGIVPKLVPSGG
jgi:hypothetical protein